MTTLFEAYKHFLCARTFMSMLYVHVHCLSHLTVMLFFRYVDNKLCGALHAWELAVVESKRWYLTVKENQHAVLYLIISS